MKTTNLIEALADIVSDKEIERVHGNLDFGGMSMREVVNDGVRKVAAGYHCGYTQQCIIIEHGLAHYRTGRSPKKLTHKGKRYLAALRSMGDHDEG